MAKKAYAPEQIINKLRGGFLGLFGCAHHFSKLKKPLCLCLAKLQAKTRQRAVVLAKGKDMLSGVNEATTKPA